MKKIKLSPAFVGFLQTIGFLSYLALFAALIMNGNAIFGPVNKTILGPMLAFSLFTFSAIICASVMLAYPFYIFWEKKDFKTAAQIVASSAFWLFIFIFFSCVLLATRP
jgi:hypothetical protein